MFINEEGKTYQPGDIVYILYRNPHVQDVANVQAAAVVSHPQNADELAIFLYDTYYPLTEEVAVFATEQEAEQAFQDSFGFSMTEDGEWQ
ncbi:transcriptional regulator SplA domain-containing protein [Paenibacillus yanchengensis]|uniref:Transcriptional regulator SplA domain-containing protein n=1 Tax=Paenibacillus yanchengensis TaxID=2035833 RepID=A0ABW4YIQ0_9BACL